MAQAIDIQDSSRTTVGTVTFHQDPQELNVQATASGFTLVIPATITLKWPDSSRPRPMVSNLRCAISAALPSGGPLQLGVARGDGFYAAAGPEWSGPIPLTWSGTFHALVAYEKTREGRPPSFQIGMAGELCYFVQALGTSVRLRSEPHAISGSTSVSYPAHVWIEMLRKLGIAESVLVEVPLPGMAPAGWELVWRHVADARAAFEQGGSTAWKNCVASVRGALTEWHKLEQEDLGGLKPPSGAEREARTIKQRLDILRWHLRECAHLGPHKTADECSRDEALLLFSTLVALLAVRKP